MSYLYLCSPGNDETADTETLDTERQYNFNCSWQLAFDAGTSFSCVFNTFTDKNILTVSYVAYPLVANVNRDNYWSYDNFYVIVLSNYLRYFRFLLGVNRFRYSDWPRAMCYVLLNSLIVIPFSTIIATSFRQSFLLALVAEYFNKSKCPWCFLLQWLKIRTR